MYFHGFGTGALIEHMILITLYHSASCSWFWSCCRNLVSGFHFHGRISCQHFSLSYFPTEL